MSGISRGSVFFTPVVMLLSVENTLENMVKTAGRIAFAAPIAVHRYSQKQEERKLKKLSDDMQKLDSEVNETLKSQREAVYTSVEQMMKSISEAQKITAGDIDASDGEAFRKLLRDTQKNTLDGIERIHAQFRKNYSEAINQSNSEILQTLTRLKENTVSGIADIEADIADRDMRAYARAASLLEDARELASSLGSDSGDRYIAQAEEDIEKGNYQSAISLAASAVTQIYMDMYRSDAVEREKEYYTGSIVYLCAALKETLDSFKSVDFKQSADSDRIMTADLTQFMKCEYEEFCRKYEETERFIASCSSRTVPELRKKTEELTELTAAVNEAAADAFYFMNYSLNRVEVEKSIYSILKEKGFTLTGTRYTDGDPSKAGERTYSCALTGEELTVSLIPYTDENSEIKTDLVLLSSESTEESREQYRRDITETLKRSCRNIDSVSIKCSGETRNMDASEAGMTTAIENPQPVQRVQR